MRDAEPSWDRLREMGSFLGRRIVEGRRRRPGRPTVNRLLIAPDPPTAEGTLSDLAPQLVGNTTSGRVSPSGRRLAFLHDTADSFWPWYTVLVSDASSAVVEPLGGDLWVAGPPLWSPDGKLVIKVREGVRIGLLAIDIDVGERWWLLRPRGVPVDEVLEAGARSVELTVHDFGVAPRRARVGETFTWLEEEAPPPEWTSHCRLTVVRWRSSRSNPTALEGVLATPSNGVAPFPMVVDVHGGPSFSLLATRMPPLHQWTARGFAAFAPEYRASGIAGREAMVAAAEWRAGPDGGTDLSDVLDGIQGLVDKGVADPQRLFLYGFSYGAVLVNRLVTTDGRFRAAVSHEGVADLALRRQVYGPDEIPTGNEPIDRVAAITTPILLVSGSAASNREQAEGFADALVAAGKTVAHHVFEGEGHELQGAAKTSALYDVSAAWYRQHDRCQRAPGSSQ